MALNKFTPTSPDLNITTDSDMTVAKFGHLNTLVDGVNNALNSAVTQAEGSPNTVTKIWSGSAAEYAALTPDSSTVYFII